MLTRLIVAPLNTLTDHVLMVGRTGDLSKRLHLERDDEIGVLSREFDGATVQLEQTRRRLLEQSYQSGMADIAAGVMHNIRNALSPVAVALWRLSETAATAPATRIDAAFAELKSDATAPERRLKLVEYVEAAMIKVINRERSIAEDLKGIAEQNRHIEQILLDHAALSMGIRRLEPVDLATAVSEAARLVPAQEGVAVEVRVAPEVAHMPAVHGNPIVVTQILGNLMVNAVEAIRTVGKRDGWIEVSSALMEEDGRAMVHLTVRDNGVGIDPANLSNLFERGFSTKRGKTGGLGLHWSANSAAAIAGRMYAESDGPGAGASFHLLLPVAPEVEEIAA
jgi:signal transduction histidine kinase